MDTIINSIRTYDDYPELLPISSKFPHIGCHLSIANSYAGLIPQMKDLDATACAFFSSTARSWGVTIPHTSVFNGFIEQCQENGIGRNQFLPHAPYIINLCSDKAEIRQKSQQRLLYDIFIVRRLGLDRLNIHPGSTRIDKKEGYRYIADAINYAVSVVPDVVVVLETMAGSKANSIVGNSFAELKQIIQLLENKSRVGVCIDTQHTYAGGFVSERSFGTSLIRQFDRIIGRKYLYGMHINGSKTEYKSCVDRHEVLGQGYLQTKHIASVIKSRCKIPICLETPQPNLYKQEIQQLKEYWNVK